MIKILFLFTLFAFCLGQLARIQLPYAIALTVLDISVFFLVTVWGITKILKKESLHGQLLKPIVIFTVVCLFTLFINSYLLKLSEFFIALSYLVRWILYASVYLVIKDERNEFKKQIPSFLTGAIIAHLLIGFTQYFFFSNLKPLFYLGWDDHLYRMFGSLLDPNFQGVLYVCFFSFLLIKFLTRKKNIKKYHSAGIAFLTIVTLIAVVLSYSRSALIMLFVSLITILVLKGNKKTVGLLFIATLVFVVLFSNVKIENLNPFRTASTSARIASMSESLVIIERHPFFGVGFNAYRYAQYRYNLRNPSPIIVSHADAGTDNSYLFILATTGVLGIVAYIYLLWSILKLGNQNSSAMGIILVSSIVGILFNALFINSLFYTFIMYWIWVIAGITESN